MAFRDRLSNLFRRVSERLAPKTEKQPPRRQGLTPEQRRQITEQFQAEQEARERANEPLYIREIRSGQTFDPNSGEPFDFSEAPEVYDELDRRGREIYSNWDEGLGSTIRDLIEQGWFNASGTADERHQARVYVLGTLGLGRSNRISGQSPASFPWAQWRDWYYHNEWWDTSSNNPANQ